MKKKQHGSRGPTKSELDEGFVEDGDNRRDG
jgi:hypothetical protein